MRYRGHTKKDVLTGAIINIPVVHHEVALFDDIDEYLMLEWSGTEWVTIKATCTFL